eukprot:12923123-Prorocentrum_lima.AAC.1
MGPKRTKTAKGEDQRLIKVAEMVLRQLRPRLRPIKKTGDDQGVNQGYTRRERQARISKARARPEDNCSGRGGS